MALAAPEKFLSQFVLLTSEHGEKGHRGPFSPREAKRSKGIKPFRSPLARFYGDLVNFFLGLCLFWDGDSENAVLKSGVALRCIQDIGRE